MKVPRHDYRIRARVVLLDLEPGVAQFAFTADELADRESIARCAQSIATTELCDRCGGSGCTTVEHAI